MGGVHRHTAARIIHRADGNSADYDHRILQGVPRTQPHWCAGCVHHPDAPCIPLYLRSGRRGHRYGPRTQVA